MSSILAVPRVHYCVSEQDIEKMKLAIGSQNSSTHCRKSVAWSASTFKRKSHFTRGNRRSWDRKSLQTQSKLPSQPGQGRTTLSYHFVSSNSLFSLCLQKRRMKQSCQTRLLFSSQQPHPQVSQSQLWRHVGSWKTNSRPLEGLHSVQRRSYKYQEKLYYL